jgi:hypothetical protein
MKTNPNRWLLFRNLPPRSQSRSHREKGTVRNVEQAFRNIDDILPKEAGCTTELKYTEQSSWLLFLTPRGDGAEEFPPPPRIFR